MSLLPRGYLDTTVAIEADGDREPSQYRTIGTGFFVALEYGGLAAGALGQ